jgi:LPPG:FO 2-phospho-L-lactate transferase
MTAILPESSTGEATAQTASPNVVVLAGGGGGALLADGLAQVLPPGRLTVIANTGDDFQHLGLTVCPDLDTVMYQIAGFSNPETGWGRLGETWRTIEEVGRLGGPEWFRLGDLDLATHLIRSHILAQGGSLTDAARHLGRQFGLAVDVWPMSNQPAPTMLVTDEGVMDFQTWFVARKWQPAVREVILPTDVRATPQVMAALEAADIVVLSPSNPFVSIDPILNVYPVREMIEDVPELVVAVSPIVAGRAVKGPTAKMMKEWNMPASAAAVAGYYGELVDLFVIDSRDDGPSDISGPVVRAVDTLMRERGDRRRLAQDILALTMGLMGQ